MGIYDKYDGYVIRQREETTGSFNSLFINLTGTIFNTQTTPTGIGFLTKLEIPFLFHQVNMPCYKATCAPYRMVASNQSNPEDNTYNWGVNDSTCAGGGGEFFISDELDYPPYLQNRIFFTVPSGRGNFYLTDVYFWTTYLGSNVGVNLLFSIGKDGSSYIDICDQQTFNDPQYGTSYVGTVFRVPFEDVNPQPTVPRGPFAGGTQIRLKNGYDYTFDSIKARMIFKGYFV